MSRSKRTRRIPDKSRSKRIRRSTMQTKADLRGHGEVEDKTRSEDNRKWKPNSGANLFRSLRGCGYGHINFRFHPKKLSDFQQNFDFQLISISQVKISDDL